MQNKRFLGLGFTFTATDKGLEKKLTRMASALHSISTSLNGINDAGKGATKALGKVGSVSAPSGGSRRIPSSLKTLAGKPSMSPRSGPTGKPDRKTAGEYTTAKPVSGTLGSISKEFGKQNEQFFSQISDSLAKLPKGTIESFKQQAASMNVMVDESGKLTEKSMLKIIDTAMDFGKSVSDIETRVKNYGKISQVVFRNIGEYLGKTTSKLDGFFQSIGVNFSEMIPEQFKKMASLIMQAISPLFSFGKYLGKLAFGKALKFVSSAFGGGKAKKESTSLLGNLKEKIIGESESGKDKEYLGKALNDFGSKLGNNKNDSVFTLLKGQKSGGKEGDKDSSFLGGLFSKLGEWAMLIPGVAPLVGLFTSLGSAITSFIGMIGPALLAGIGPAIALAGAGAIGVGIGTLIDKLVISKTEGTTKEGFKGNVVEQLFFKMDKFFGGENAKNIMNANGYDIRKEKIDDMVAQGIDRKYAESHMDQQGNFSAAALDVQTSLQTQQIQQNAELIALQRENNEKLGAIHQATVDSGKKDFSPTINLKTSGEGSAKIEQENALARGLTR